MHEKTIAEFRRAVESADATAVLSFFADDVEFKPCATTGSFKGLDTISAFVPILLKTWQNLRYQDELSSGDSVALVFTAGVDDVPVEGVDLLRFDDNGKIVEFAALVRPLNGLQALAQAMQRAIPGYTSHATTG